METFHSISEIRARISKLKKRGKSIGFVPTMGALHEGHLSLIRKSRQDNSITVCSIFVNPTQFNNPYDLENYPRTLKEDLKILAMEGSDIVFVPEVEEMYPGGVTGTLDIDFGRLERILEGKFRPGHFRGVTLVVKKLFEIVHPDKSYFGKKDYQQLLIIRKLVELYHIPVEIIACPIVREPDGLAMSSRNMRLSIGERSIAPFIYQVLTGMKEKGVTSTLKEIKNWGIKKLKEIPEFRVEYLEIVNRETLLPLDTWRNRKNALILAAVYLNDIRLIDNIELF